MSNTSIVTISEGDIEDGAYLYIMYSKNDLSMDIQDAVSIGTLLAPCTASGVPAKVSEIAATTANAKIFYETIEDGSDIVPLKLGYTAETNPFTLFLFKLL